MNEAKAMTKMLTLMASSRQKTETIQRACLRTWGATAPLTARYLGFAVPVCYPNWDHDHRFPTVTAIDSHLVVRTGRDGVCFWTRADGVR